MNDIIEVIKGRRNIQSYLPKYVSWEMISKVVDAARHAPSCGNVQNWKFIVVLEPEIKQKLAEAAYEQYYIAMAGALIVVCGEPEKAERYYGQKGKDLFSIQNCAAAAQNMQLEAYSLGLGTSWIGGFDEEQVRTILMIPEEVNPQVIIAVGYPKEIPQKPQKYPLETVIYFNKWRNKVRDPAKYMLDIATVLARKAGAVKEIIKRKTNLVLDKAKEKIK